MPVAQASQAVEQELVSVTQDTEDKAQAFSPTLESEAPSHDVPPGAQESVIRCQEEPLGTTQTASPVVQESSPFIHATVPKTSSPDGIETKFNWGAFVTPFGFGIAHRVYLGLLSLLVVVPIIGWIFAIVWAFVFGFNGEKWALENPANQYRDNEEFRKVMSSWHRFGLVTFIISSALIAIYIIILIVILSSFSHYYNDYNYYNY
ncbi:hypothetical protein RyT2_15530 [Pseudolactococcus yaeyamensis]